MYLHHRLAYHVSTSLGETKKETNEIKYNFMEGKVKGCIITTAQPTICPPRGVRQKERGEKCKKSVGILVP